MEVNRNPKSKRLTLRESGILDSVFGEEDSEEREFSLEMPDNENGFSSVSTESNLEIDNKSINDREIFGNERTGNSFLETKMLPFTIMTDGNTATQVVMLLEMIRYCMENSKDIIDTKTGEAKEYDIHLKIRNRGKSNFLVSIGDESMGALPLSENGWFIGS